MRIDKFLIKLIFFIAWLFSINSYSGIVVKKSEPKTGNENSRAPKPKYFEKGEDHPLGVRPDCSEKKGSVAILEDIAKKPGMNDINSFLQSIPQDMFQTFTLVTNSRSAQRGEGEEIVSEEWPRVLRTTADGKITFSYTCNPKSSTHNTVEVMYFDDKTNKTRTVSINLNAKDPKSRIHHDDKKCLACHGSVMPDGSTNAKYIWPEYFQWGGCQGKDTINLYGSNDDNMAVGEFRHPLSSHEYSACKGTEIEDKKLREIESFKKFKEKNLGVGANNNPCYSSLPWAKPTGEVGSQYDPKKYLNYPYASNREDTSSFGNSDGKENYYLRTNLRFTELYSRQNAKQIFGLISQSPKYNSIKYFLALEAAGCVNEKDDARIKSLFPGLDYKSKRSEYFNESNPASTSPLLYAYGKSIGIKDSDWSLEFKAKNSTYNAAIPRTAKISGKFSQDTGMAEVASGFILKDIESESPSLRASMNDGYTRGAAEGFGEQWSCIDDLGGAVRESHQGQDKMVCKDLRELLEKNTAEDPLTVCTNNLEAPAGGISGLEGDVSSVVNSLNKIDAKKGSGIVENRCVWCHLKEEDQQKYKKGEPIPKEKLDEVKRKIARSDLLEDNLRSGIMPQDDPVLSKEDAESVIMYMKSLK